MTSLLWTEGQVDWRVEIALGGGEGNSIWDTALWDSGIWAGTQATWTIISTRVLDVRTSRGRDTWRERMRTGNASILVDNSDGIFNPDAGETPPGDLVLRPGRLIRVSVSAEEGYVPVFTGYIDALDEQYAPGGADVLTLIRAYGFAGNMAADDPPALSTPIPPGQLTSDRVQRLLDDFNYPIELRDGIQTGVHTMSESSLARSILEESQRAATAEGGAFFWSANGEPLFKARDWLTTDPRSTTVQARPGFRLLPDEPRVIAVDSDWSTQRIFNDVQLSRVGGTTQRVVSSPSISLYGTRTIRVTDLECETDAQVLALADRLIVTRQFDKIRVESLELHAETVEQARVMIGLRLGDLIRAQVETLQGWSYAIEAHINRIEFRVTGSDWTQTLRIDDSLTTIPPGQAGAFDPEAFSDGFFIGTQ